LARTEKFFADDEALFFSAKTGEPFPAVANCAQVETAARQAPTTTPNILRHNGFT